MSMPSWCGGSSPGAAPKSRERIAGLCNDFVLSPSAGRRPKVPVLSKTSVGITFRFHVIACVLTCNYWNTCTWSTCKKIWCTCKACKFWINLAVNPAHIHIVFRFLKNSRNSDKNHHHDNHIAYVILFWIVWLIFWKYDLCVLLLKE